MKITFIFRIFPGKTQWHYVLFDIINPSTTWVISLHLWKEDFFFYKQEVHTVCIYTDTCTYTHVMYKQTEVMRGQGADSGVASNLVLRTTSLPVGCQCALINV